jgi:hypothetical protein
MRPDRRPSGWLCFARVLLRNATHPPTPHPTFEDYTMKNLLITTLLATGLTLGACGSEEDDPIDLNSTLVIENSSDFAFVEINLSSVDNVSWGSDLLGSDILFPGESVEIGGIECDDYDIRVVDEDNDECIVENIDLCLTDESWVIDNAVLFGCAF